jgi:hypothetical protein
MCRTGECVGLERLYNNCKHKTPNAPSCQLTQQVMKAINHRKAVILTMQMQ